MLMLGYLLALICVTKKISHINCVSLVRKHFKYKNLQSLNCTSFTAAHKFEGALVESRKFLLKITY